MYLNDKTEQFIYNLGKQKGVICGIFIGVGGVILGACAFTMMMK